ncbi:MAG: alpha-amylase family glycosyl hydrolase [Anaerolineae bacterium]
MDHIFGTFASDQLKLVHHQVEHSGIQHAGRIAPLDPLPGQQVTLFARVGAESGIDRAAVYYTIDGSVPVGNRGHAVRGQVVSMQRVSVEWDSLSWSYVATWIAELPPQADQTTVRYIISGWADGADEIFADYPNVQRTAELAAAAFFRNEPLPLAPVGDPLDATVFSYRVDTVPAPKWARDSIIYHIFVDRFFAGNGKTWQQTDDLEGVVGGTLWGVRDKLDYLCDLGATALWLSPTWVSPSHHGYDIVDYCMTDPRYGGDVALKALVEEAHRRGLRVILDLVANHMSHTNPIFEQAHADARSPYRDWFTFDDSTLGYRSFFGVRSMPQINVDNAHARRYLLDVARHWIREFDVDGYRLDYANGPSLDFWTDFRSAVHDEKHDAFIFGEVVDAPDAVRQYAGHLDGCLDFFASETLRKAYGWKSITPADADRVLKLHADYYPSDFVLPTFLDNHDMDRFLLIANGDKEALRQAAIAQMRLPAPPVIYYGTEVGLSQRKSVSHGNGLHMSREPMLWGEDQDAELLGEYKRLIRERKAARTTTSR